MKLRIHRNNIRLRLSREEVERFGRGEAIEERTASFPAALVYRIASAEIGQIAAEFSGGALIVRLPIRDAKRWADGEEIGIEAEIAAMDGDRVQILVEKDFQCLHGSAAAQEDCFPNQQAAEK
jgi:hypothetical protein